MKIENQILITTNIDSHGERLTKRELEQLLSTFPEKMILNNNHDLSLPPIATAEKAQLVPFDESEWAIKAEITIFDEEAFSDKGGFSLSWLADNFTKKTRS